MAIISTKQQINRKKCFTQNPLFVILTPHKQKQRRNTMTKVALTKEQEIEQAYAQLQAQERQAKEAAWKQADKELEHQKPSSV